MSKEAAGYGVVTLVRNASTRLTADLMELLCDSAFILE